MYAMSRDSFNLLLQGSNVPDSGRWDIIQVVTEMARKMYAQQAKGTYITKPEARTSGGRTYYRKSVAGLREAMERDHAAPSSVDVTMNMTIGFATITLVSISTHFGTYAGSDSLRISVVGSDRGTVETFGSRLLEELKANTVVRSGAPDAKLRLEAVSVWSQDTGTGQVGVSALGWLTGLGLTVFGGVLTQVAIKLLRLD